MCDQRGFVKTVGFSPIPPTVSNSQPSGLIIHSLTLCLQAIDEMSVFLNRKDEPRAGTFRGVGAVSRKSVRPKDAHLAQFRFHDQHKHVHLEEGFPVLEQQTAAHDGLTAACEW